MPRLHCTGPLTPGQALPLPVAAARHAQVLRLQPGGRVTLFDGGGGEFMAVVEQMGRSDVHVRIESHDPVEREARQTIHLAVGMPANERMDWLVEKATELGAASILPLVAERSVVRLTGERAARKQAHWQAVAIAACEQCGRNRVPAIHPPLQLAQWLQALQAGSPSVSAPGQRRLLSLDAPSRTPQTVDNGTVLTLLSGPEGGLSAGEEAAARRAGFSPFRLGPRTLRAETAPLAALARWAE